MDTLKFRTLRADEIECRIGTVKEPKDGKEGGVSLLLYKDARCDMNILDETVGAMNWKREHCRDNRNCVVSLWDEWKQEWVTKEDTGTESNTEAEKGLASDSFKRACVNWGIGRELYTAPFIWISGNPKDLKVERFTVDSISYDNNRNIYDVVIKDKRGTVVFQTGKTARKTTPKQEVKKSTDEEVSEAECLLFSQEICRNHNLSFETEARARNMNPLKMSADEQRRLCRDLCRYAFGKKCEALGRGTPRAMEYYGVNEGSSLRDWIEATKKIQELKQEERL